MSNARGQSPCTVYAYLSAVCDPSGTWAIGPPGNPAYNPPTAAFASTCQCNGVSYNLIEGCSYCQGHQVGDWSHWIANCPPTDTSPDYKPDVPPETMIPDWAFVDFTETTGLWDPNVARQYAGAQRKSLNLPAIIGGSVGGGVGLIILLIVWYFWCRSPRRPQQTQQIPTGAIANLNQAHPPPAAAAAAQPPPPVGAANPTTNGGQPPNGIPPAASPRSMSESATLRPNSLLESRNPSEATANEEIRVSVRYSKENLVSEEAA